MTEHEHRFVFTASTNARNSVVVHYACSCGARISWTAYGDGREPHGVLHDANGNPTALPTLPRHLIVKNPE